MKPLQLLTILAVCCAFGPITSIALAAEPTPAKPATPAAAKPADESAAPKADEQTSPAQPSATAKGTQGQQDKAAAEEQQAAAKAKAPSKSSPERFVPSEQVRADFDVSFPIDI